MVTEVMEQTTSFLPEGEELANRQLYNVPLDRLISDPNQPRKFFDDEALAELKTSIERHGVLQPVLFRKDEQGQLVLVSGERRFRASQLAGQESIPAIFNGGGNSAEIALVENLLRENLNPIEEAEALQQLKVEQGYTNEQISAVIGKAISTISEILSLNKLPAEVKDVCRQDPKVSRRALVVIAKEDSAEAMKSLFEKYQRMELKSDAVRAERQAGASLAASWKKKVQKFSKQLGGVNFDEFAGDRGSVETVLQELVVLIRSKIPATE